MAIDPLQFPLDPGFEQDSARGIALGPERLSAAAVRRRFLQPGPWRAELTGDDRMDDDGAQPAAAAVLIVLVQRDERLTVLFTHRARHLQAHAGQISFPGGRIEQADRGPVEAALREAAEETGLPAARIDVLGQLPVYRTITRFDVTPVVGLIASPFTLALARDEVEDAFEVPLSFLMDPRNHQRRVAGVRGERRFVYAMPFHDGRREHFIWGATAAIVRNFYGFLRG
jgi:8-oxo-dGTP pyrophosphatase MutT (NUDIX family)